MSIHRDISALLNNPALCFALLRRLEACLEREFSATNPFRFMEVCGTHTVSLFRSGLASLLPPNVMHLSGPGCPVCVTHDREIACAIELALRPDTLIATFGDLMRVPGPDGRSLKWAKARGARIEIVYSPQDALALARASSDRTVVFLGVGFETTAPTVAATILAAKKANLSNFTVLCLHKRVPPALEALCSSGNRIHGFLLPGHVCAVTGTAPYRFLPEKYRMPSAVAGFEPADILEGLISLASQHADKAPDVYNQYSRVVSTAGNPRAMDILYTVFEETGAVWRGLEAIPASGFAIRPEFAEFDSVKRLDVQFPEVKKNAQCRCGEVLKGRMKPTECPLFGKRCTPSSPVGPCMVSTEGGCAAYYAYKL